MAEIKLIPGGQQDQTPVSAQSPLKNPWVFFQEYRQNTEPGGTIINDVDLEVVPLRRGFRS